MTVRHLCINTRYLNLTLLSTLLTVQANCTFFTWKISTHVQNDFKNRNTIVYCTSTGKLCLSLNSNVDKVRMCRRPSSSPHLKKKLLAVPNNNYSLFDSSRSVVGLVCRSQFEYTNHVLTKVSRIFTCIWTNMHVFSSIFLQ